MAKFRKGQSGNPGGRPRESLDMKLLCRQHGETAVATLVRAMRSRNLRVAILAAQAVLDRGYGRPVQAVAQTDNEGRNIMPNVWIVPASEIGKIPDPNLPSPPVVIIPPKDRVSPETGEVEPKGKDRSH